MPARIPRTTRTLAAASDPKRACRPESSRPISRHWLRTYSSVQTRPAMARPRNHVHSGRSCEMASAEKTKTTPSQPRSPRMRFTISTAPAFGIDRLGGHEQAEGNEAQVVREMLRVDDALGEVVEVIRDREEREN